MIASLATNDSQLHQCQPEKSDGSGHCAGMGTQRWRNKIADGFTNSGALNGDNLNSLVTLALFAAQHGMIWVGLEMMPGYTKEDTDRIGGWLGAMAQSNDESPELSPIESDLQTAAHLSQRVAEVTLEFMAGKLAS